MGALYPRISVRALLIFLTLYSFNVTASWVEKCTFSGLVIDMNEAIDVFGTDNITIIISKASRIDPVSSYEPTGYTDCKAYINTEMRITRKVNRDQITIDAGYYISFNWLHQSDMYSTSNEYLIIKSVPPLTIDL